MSDLIKNNLSEAFQNKTNLTGDKATFGNSFIPHEHTPEHLIQHITQGKAWTQGYFNGHSRRKENFVSAQTLALDLDDKISVDEALSKNIIRDYALLVHPSPSSTPEYPKTRVVFLLDEAIHNRKTWEQLQRALIEYFADLRPDPACKDAARLFYGSDQPGAHINITARLPRAIVAGWIADTDQALEATRHDAPGNIRDKGGQGGELSPELVRDVETALSVHNAPVNGEGFIIKAIACPVKHHEHDNETPAAYWHPGIHALKCFKCGETYNTHQVADALGIDTAPYYHTAKSAQAWADLPETDKFQRRMERRSATLDRLYPAPDITINSPFITPSDIPADKSVLLESPIGTGKTTALQHISTTVETVEIANDKRALTHTLGIAHNADYYEDFGALKDENGLTVMNTRDDIQNAKRLAISVDSYYRRENTPSPHLWMGEEIDNIARKPTARIMNDEKRTLNTHMLNRRIRHSKRVIAVQADISPVGVQFMRQLRTDIVHIRNAYTPDRGTATFTTHPAIPVFAAFQIAEQGGITIIASDSVTLLQSIEVAASVKGIQTASIHGRIGQEVKKTVREINQKAKAARKSGQGLLVLLSPSADAGLSLDGPEQGGVIYDLKATVISGTKGLSPQSYVQMNGRGRVAAQNLLYVPGNITTEPETDAKRLFQDYMQRADETATAADFVGHDLEHVDAMQKWLAALDAQYTAFHNLLNRDRLGFTAAFLKRAGYTPEYDATEPDKAMRQWYAEMLDTWKHYREIQTKTVEAVDKSAFEQLELNGLLKREHFFGRERDKIQRAAGGRDVNTEGIYERHYKPSQRQKNHRVDLLTFERGEAQRLDRAEAIRLPQHRSHNTVTQDFYMKGWRILLGQDVQTLNDVFPLLKHWKASEDDLKRFYAYCEGVGMERALLLLNYRSSVNVEDTLENMRDKKKYAGWSEEALREAALLLTQRRMNSSLFHAFCRAQRLNVEAHDVIKRTVHFGNHKSRVQEYSYSVTPLSLKLLVEDVQYRAALRAREALEQDVRKVRNRYYDHTQITDTLYDPPQKGHDHRQKRRSQTD